MPKEENWKWLKRKNYRGTPTSAFLTHLPVLQMVAGMVLAQPSLIGKRKIKSGHDRDNWAFMSILNHNLAISFSPFGCLPSAVWVYMLCGIYGSGQQNNNKLAHYKWFGGNSTHPLCPPLTVKQRRAIGQCNPKGEPCLCMGALYNPQPPPSHWTHRLQHTNKLLLHILPDHTAAFIHCHLSMNMICGTLVSNLWTAALAKKQIIALV